MSRPTLVVDDSPFDETAPPLLPPTQALLREPPGVLAPLAGAFATTAADPASQREGFRIGALHLMVRYEDGDELSEMPAVFALPAAPPWFLGISNLHGALVPVFDVAAHWGCGHQEGAKPMLLVLGHGPERAALVIDGLPTRLRPGEADRLLDAAVPEPLQGLVSSVHRIEGCDWMDVGCAALLERLQRELADKH